MIKIANGQVYDPANGIKGAVKDIYIEGDKIVAGPDRESAGSPIDIIDASGLVVMPGGVEIHSHIAGPKVNSGRLLCPEDHYEHFRARTSRTRSGSGCTTPTSFYTGYLYATMGYTTAFEAAAPPLEARHVHEELRDMPLLDTGFYTLMGNNYLVMKTISDVDAPRRREQTRDLVAWLLRASKGYAVKAVNPGGVENWKWGRGEVDLDTPVPPFGVTPRQILEGLVEAVEDLRLPHSLHLHANHLGQPGNFRTTLETMGFLSGHRVHFTHLQFHSYAATKKGGIRSAAPQVAEYLNQHPEFTCDAGQIVFGPATTMTADAPMQFNLHRLTGNKWSNCDIEMESGSGVVPLNYRPEVLVNAVQWAIGLELLLLVTNPWQIFLTTDHPNAGPFTAYPQIIHLLMDADYRREWLAKLNPRVQRYTCLAELNREYTLEEIAIITRAGPARALGLTRKGHLGPGADADIAIYRPCEDKQAMFARAAYVIKSGKPIIREGQIMTGASGRTLMVAPPAPSTLPMELQRDFAEFYTVSLANYGVEDEYVANPEVVPCA